jgi:hypothetical protein
MNPRLIGPAYYLEIAMLDAVATRELSEPSIASGFDDDFREIVVFSAPQRESAKQERPPLFIPSQIESPTLEMLMQMGAGNTPDSKVTLVWARKDLVARDLIVPETGETLIRVNDRVVAIRDKCMNLIRKIRTPPGLYITEIRPTWGMAALGDLFVVTLEDRQQGVQQA